MQKIILDFLHEHGESEFNTILDAIMHHQKDFTVSNLRSIVTMACNQLIQANLIILTATTYDDKIRKHLCYYNII